MRPNNEVIRPLMRPFVLRPVALVATPAGFLAAASYFFWAPLQELLSSFALLLPIVCAAVPLLVLAERLIRYRKTDYEVRADRILVRTGTLFTARAVELELENVTLVEWKSPFLLRKFYDVGHVTAQEAGSSTQSARLAYVERPEALYDRIAEHMRERGFSMQRSSQIRRERPGPIGALIDMAGRLAALIYAVIVFGATQGAELWLLFADDTGPSVWQLIVGNYEVFSETTFAVDMLIRMRLGILVLGTLFLLVCGVLLTLTYIDLLRRTYTLHDDVIDYFDGFLSETRRFIPLENLADTKLTRPLHKRVLGFGDLRVSSRGAGSEIVFRSLPRGRDFAEALEELLEQTDAPGERASGPSSADPQLPGQPREYTIDPDSPIETRRQLPARTFKAWPMRAVVSALVGLVPMSLVFLGGPAVAVATGDTFELGPITIGSLSALGLAALAVVGALGAIGVTRQLIVALATRYSFDHRRATERFDFLSSREIKFSVDKITSMSVLQTPLDRLMGTMTVRLRSIGTRETIDFRHIRYDDELLDGLRRALGLGGQGFRGATEQQGAAITLEPEFSLVEAVNARLPLFACVPLVWVLGFGVGALVDLSGWFVAGAVALTVIPIAPYLVWRGMYHRRLRGELFEEHLEVSGGVLSRFCHLAAYRHVKALTSVRYPSSKQGDLALATGGGFVIAVGHLPEIGTTHDRVDDRLLEHPPRGRRPRRDRDTDLRRFVPYAPHAFTEVVRHLRLVITALTLPVSGPWVYVLYRRADYRLESTRVLAEIGLVYRRRTTVLYDRIDHLETSRNFAHGLFGTRDVEIYTVGSDACELTLRSMKEAELALERIRERMALDDR